MRGTGSSWRKLLPCLLIFRLHKGRLGSGDAEINTNFSKTSLRYCNSSRNLREKIGHDVHQVDLIPVWCGGDVSGDVGTEENALREGR